MVGDRGVDTKTEPQLSIYNSADCPQIAGFLPAEKGTDFPSAMSVEKGLVSNV